MAMIDIDFDNIVENHGMANISIEAGNSEFTKGLNDSCLNLTGTSNRRGPVILTCNEESSLAEYKEFTVEIWIKKIQDDNDSYTVAGSMNRTENEIRGWKIGTTCEGSWIWQLSDGKSVWTYKPTPKLQNLNDDKWHQLAFSVNSKMKEARLYFDGKNRAVYSLPDIKNSCSSNEYFIGSDPLAINAQMEAFNGLIDNFKLWARALSDNDISRSYFVHTGITLPNAPAPEDKLRVMTWNIWHGGKHYGKTVGVQRVTNIIRDANPDIVVLQDTEGSGEKIADAMNYYFFSRSRNLSVLSRFPLGHTYDIFRPDNFGCININAGRELELLVCPVWLNPKPNIGAYVMTGKAIPDTIIDREMQTRGLQMRFILGELSSFALNQNKTMILAGDFNSGSHLDWTERNKKAHHGLVVRYPVSSMLQNNGYSDTYRTVNPDETDMPGITWSPVFKNTLQDRIDFIYCKGSALTPESSYVINNYIHDFPSSHAALVTVFSINKPSE